MKYYLTLFLFSLSFASFGQGFYERHTKLESWVDSINAGLDQYHHVKLENEEFLGNMSDHGGTLIGYYAGDELQKIKVWVGISYGQYEYHYYFRNGQLYFINETFKQYKYDVDTDKWDYSNLELTFNGDYLFATPFDYETLGHNRFENDELDPEKVLLAEAKGYIDILNEKKNAR